MTGAAIEAWDEVFIRAPRVGANAQVVDPARWAAWWPGCQVRPLGEGRSEVTFTSRWPVPARQRLVVTVDRVRPRDKGLEFSVDGDVVGSGEWFHLDEPNGVVVHWLLRGECVRRMPRLWLAAHRGIVRAGLTSLKDRLEQGRPAGVEPDPALLAHQAQELAIFAEEVARHEREKALARHERDTALAHDERSADGG